MSYSGVYNTTAGHVWLDRALDEVPARIYDDPTPHNCTVCSTTVVATVLHKQWGIRHITCAFATGMFVCTEYRVIFKTQQVELELPQQ